jgi:uncharacterized protein YidB (DUF937 family)
MVEMLMKLFGMVPNSQKAKLMGAAMGALGGGGGGLAGLTGLLGRFQSAGLQDKADSWVGDGPNARLSSDEVGRALGDDQIAEIAAQAGVSPAQAKRALSKMIPDAVNEMTPEGHLPADDPAFESAAGALRARLGV